MIFCSTCSWKIVISYYSISFNTWGHIFCQARNEQGTSFIKIVTYTSCLSGNVLVLSSTKNTASCVLVIVFLPWNSSMLPILRCTDSQKTNFTVAYTNDDKDTRDTNFVYIEWTVLSSRQTYKHVVMCTLIFFEATKLGWASQNDYSLP